MRQCQQFQDDFEPVDFKVFALSAVLHFLRNIGLHGYNGRINIEGGVLSSNGATWSSLMRADFVSLN